MLEYCGEVTLYCVSMYIAETFSAAYSIDDIILFEHYSSVRALLGFVYITTINISI